uniref:Uncharacterized protein n=1 Tax=Brassica campestris TaxID=3711 RepID=A0A3P6AH54_BRACM|nr:unnamed protein product [Brassica rapa]
MSVIILRGTILIAYSLHNHFFAKTLHYNFISRLRLFTSQWQKEGHGILSLDGLLKLT